MKILALDSSGLVAGVAVTEDDNLLGEYTINYKKTHSQTLLPMLDEVAKMIELDLNTIDVIAVSAGPGSFTGLRIGSATAKGLALALNKQIVSVPTVDALAYNLWGCGEQICPLMDARRQQTYTGLYTFSDGQMQTLLPQCAVGIDEITAKINESGKKTVFLGDGVPVFADYLKENLHASPSLSQAQRLKKLSQEGGCTLDAMCEVMNEIKKDELDHVTIKNDVLRKYFPKSYTPKQMQDTIIRLLEKWQRSKQRDMER